MADTAPVVVATPIVSAVKSGIQTTEFILTIFVNIVTVGMTFANMLPAGLEAIILAVVNSVYVIMRAIVKNGDPAYTVPTLPAAVSAVAQP